MKENRIAMTCNFIAAFAWLCASVLYFAQSNTSNGVVFLCLTLAQTGIACMSLSAYRRAKKDREDPERND